MNYLETRVKLGTILHELQGWLRLAMIDHPEFLDTKNCNNLVRYIWNKYGSDVNVASILRQASLIRTETRLKLNK